MVKFRCILTDGNTQFILGKESYQDKACKKQTNHAHSLAVNSQVS